MTDKITTPARLSSAISGDGATEEGDRLTGASGARVGGVTHQQQPADGGSVHRSGAVRYCDFTRRSWGRSGVGWLALLQGGRAHNWWGWRRQGLVTFARSTLLRRKLDEVAALLRPEVCGGCRGS